MGTVSRASIFSMLLLYGQHAYGLTVTQPSSPLSIPSGRDYATETLGNPWLMDDESDIVTTETGDMVEQSFSAGLFSARTTGNDPGFYSLFHGIPGTVNLTQGDRHPVQTQTYRHLTLKIRIRTASGIPLSPFQPIQAFYYAKGSSPALPGTFGQTGFIYISPETWSIVTFDLNQDHLPGSPTWQGFPLVSGLRIDPTFEANAIVEVDWIRLTAPGSSVHSVPVQWSDPGSGPYTVSAIDAGGTAYELAANVLGPTAQADLSPLAPGTYRLRVSSPTTFADSPALISINAPPVAEILNPSHRGDPTREYAIVERGNAWGPFEPSDILLAGNLTNIRFDDPPGSGSFAGRPTSGDPGVVFASAPHGIDANLYRTLCFTLQIEGGRDIGAGSVARVFWGSDFSHMSTSQDIIIDEGLNEYCVEDMASIPVVSGSLIPWSGTVALLRLDPHEFPIASGCSASPQACRDFRLDSVRLSPLANANPDVRFQWNLHDPDSSTITLRLAIDADENPTNGNEITVHSAFVTSGPSSWRWRAPSNLEQGTYFLLFDMFDGLNRNFSYAAGRIEVPPSHLRGDAIFVVGFDY